MTAAGAAEQEPPSPAAPHGRTRTGGGGGRAHSAARFCFLLLRAPRRTGIYKSSALDQTYCKYRLCFCLFVGWGGRTALFVCLNRVLARDPPLSWPFWRERRACSDKKQTKLCANKRTGCFCFCCLVIQQPKFFGSFHTSKKQLPALFLGCCRALDDAEDNYDIFSNSCPVPPPCRRCGGVLSATQARRRRDLASGIHVPPGAEPPALAPRRVLRLSELRRLRRMRDILRPRWAKMRSTQGNAKAARATKRKRPRSAVDRRRCRPRWALPDDQHARLPGERRCDHARRTDPDLHESISQSEPPQTLRERLFDISKFLQEARVRLRAGTARSGLSRSTEAIFEGPRTRRAIAAWRRRQASPELIEQLKHGVKWP